MKQPLRADDEEIREARAEIARLRAALAVLEDAADAMQITLIRLEEEQ